MLFLEYPPCSTCRKAKTWLQEQGFSFEDRDIKADRPTVEELRQWHSRKGGALKQFVNTSGLVYRSLGLKERWDSMTEEEQLALLASDGMLVKRPLVVTGNVVLAGFKPAEWEQALKGRME